MVPVDAIARISEAHPFHKDAADAASLAANHVPFSRTLRCGGSECGHNSESLPVFVYVTTSPPPLGVWAGGHCILDVLKRSPCP